MFALHWDADAALMLQVKAAQQPTRKRKRDHQPAPGEAAALLAEAAAQAMAPAVTSELPAVAGAEPAGAAAPQPVVAVGSNRGIAHGQAAADEELLVEWAELEEQGLTLGGDGAATEIDFEDFDVMLGGPFEDEGEEEGAELMSAAGEARCCLGELLYIGVLALPTTS